jgi:hypothetical protein
MQLLGVLGVAVDIAVEFPVPVARVALRAACSATLFAIVAVPKTPVHKDDGLPPW